MDVADLVFRTWTGAVGVGGCVLIGALVLDWRAAAKLRRKHERPTTPNLNCRCVIAPSFDNVNPAIVVDPKPLRPSLAEYYAVDNDPKPLRAVTVPEGVKVREIVSMTAPPALPPGYWVQDPAIYLHLGGLWGVMRGNRLIACHIHEHIARRCAAEMNAQTGHDADGRPRGQTRYYARKMDGAWHVFDRGAGPRPVSLGAYASKWSAERGAERMNTRDPR